jgi:adenine-specific DNA methylase
MMWDHAEVNPFVKGSGTLISINKAILDSLEYSISKLEARGGISTSNLSILQLNGKTKLIVTDPPYFDDIQYAELSEFFFVWEKRALFGLIEAQDIPKSEEMSVGGWGRTPEFFNKLFYKTCNKMAQILDDDGLLVMFFAHSSIDAWDFVLNSLQQNGFRITATWPVHTESPDNLIARGNASIMSSIIIVARKRKSDKSGYIEEIQDEVKAHLLKRLDEFWNYGLRGADLTVSAMGATLDIITQYSNIKSYTGEMQIKDVLELVQKYVAQYVLDRYMKNASGLDAATSFYLYTRLSQLEGMPFDTANLIAKSMNLDLKLFEKQGLIETWKKGKSQGIKILIYTNRETNPKQSLIDCVQFVMTTFARGGYTEVERELATITFSRNEIKDVLEALLALPTEDPERQVAQKILERMGQSFPKQGQTGLDNF